MTQEQIKQASEALANLSPEQKDAFKQKLMTELAKIDNLGEISQESLEKIAGGDYTIRQILGLWIDNISKSI